MESFFDPGKFEATPEPIRDDSQEIKEVRPEDLETQEVDKQVEQATFEPEAVVERGDYQQAEAIEAAFVKSVEEPVVLPEIIQPAPGISDVVSQEKIVEEKPTENITQTEDIGKPHIDMQDEDVLPIDRNSIPEVIDSPLEQVSKSEETPIPQPETTQSKPGLSDAFPQTKVIEEETTEITPQTEVVDKPVIDELDEVAASNDKNPVTAGKSVTLELVFPDEPTLEGGLHQGAVIGASAGWDKSIPTIVTEDDDQSTQPQPGDPTDVSPDILDEEAMEKANVDLDTEKVMETDEIKAMEALGVAREAAYEAKLAELKSLNIQPTWDLFGVVYSQLMEKNSTLLTILSENGFDIS